LNDYDLKGNIARLIFSSHRPTSAKPVATTGPIRRRRGGLFAGTGAPPT